ncbi:MAG: hypothetical protein JWO26_534 [Rhodospirillales bacterium]|nr:hypothetical protein [Rhodospirillales bacterium]
MDQTTQNGTTSEHPTKRHGRRFDVKLTDRRVLTTPQASELLTISIPALERHRKARTGPRFIQLGKRRVGYRLDDLEAWLEANAIGGERAA